MAVLRFAHGTKVDLLFIDDCLLLCEFIPTLLLTLLAEQMEIDLTQRKAMKHICCFMDELMLHG